MVALARTFDFLKWLLPATNHFPRAHRFTLTKRLLDATLDLSELLQEANYKHGQARMRKLRQVDEALDKVRFYLRLTAQLDWLSAGQYKHAAEMVAEIGRLVGGWTKDTQKRRQ